MYATDDLVKALVDPSCIFCNIWANRAEKNSPVIDLSENFFAIPDLHKKDDLAAVLQCIIHSRKWEVASIFAAES